MLTKPSVSAATAAVVSAALRLRLIKILQRLDGAHDWVAPSATEAVGGGMPTPDHSFVSLPLAITGPVGSPVGEPPGGSNDTASVACGVTRPIMSAGTLMCTGRPASISPS